MNIRTVLVIALGITLILGGIFLYSNKLSERYSIEQARNIALQAIPGEVVKEEFENKRGRSMYEFYVRKSNGDMYEVYVDAESAKVIKVERDD